MNKVYTIEEIETALESAGDYGSSIRDFKERLISELQKPAWVPKEGEYYLYREIGGSKDWKPAKCYSAGALAKRNERRPLTNKERDIERFEYINDCNNPFDQGYRRAIDNVNRTLGFTDE